MSTSVAPSEIAGTSQWKSQVAVIAPSIWATMKPGTSAGRMPAKVSLADLAIVTAGFANEVEAVKQYAAEIYAPTPQGTAAERRGGRPHSFAYQPTRPE